MDIVHGATRAVTQTANATTAVAGAVSGAAISGVIGAAQGTAAGIRSGLSAGSHSTPAALLTLGVIGATGLVEWPLLLTVGGAALVVRQFSGGQNGEGKATAPASTSSSRPASRSSSRRRSPAKKSSPRARKSTASARR